MVDLQKNKCLSSVLVWFEWVVLYVFIINIQDKIFHLTFFISRHISRNLSPCKYKYLSLCEHLQPFDQLKLFLEEMEEFILGFNKCFLLYYSKLLVYVCFCHKYEYFFIKSDSMIYMFTV